MKRLILVTAGEYDDYHPDSLYAMNVDKSREELITEFAEDNNIEVVMPPDEKMKSYTGIEYSRWAHVPSVARVHEPNKAQLRKDPDLKPWYTYTPLDDYVGTALYGWMVDKGYAEELEYEEWNTEDFSSFEYDQRSPPDDSGGIVGVISGREC